MIDARRYRVEEALRDGTSVIVRAVRADDRDRIAQAFHALDRESVYTRFFSLKNALSDAELDRLAAMDFVREVMLVATAARGRRGAHRAHADAASVRRPRRAQNASARCLTRARVARASVSQRLWHR
jgi:hypothetical protein